MRVRKRSLKNKESLKEERPSFFKKHRQVDPQMTQSEFFRNSNIQTKLKFGKVGDPMEKQADSVADKVVTNTGETRPIQRSKDSTEANKSLRKKEERTSFFGLQRAEEEEAQTKSEIQKQEEEEAQTKLEIQKQVEEEEEPLQTKLETQKQEEEEAQTKIEVQQQSESEKEQIAAKLEVQNKISSKNTIAYLQTERPINNLKPSKVSNGTLEEKIKSAKNAGHPLSEKIREEMELKMNSDFSKVRIHTDNKAISLCKSIKAQAFTTGYHIFFNKGKYQPESSVGKHLLAHELTHVIQQKKVSKRASNN